MRSGVKAWAMMITALLVFSLVLPAYAGTSRNDDSQYQYNGSSAELEQRLLNVPAFKFWIHQNGIGYGDCPVYTAPSEQAFRCANGRASCSTNSSMGEAGFFNGWLLVRYETNNGGVRVGYIPPRYVSGFRSEISAPARFDYIPATAAATIYVTDNPMVLGSYYATLDYGEQFFILGKYTYYGDWWYIECTVDGQTARGFIDRSSSSFNLGSSPNPNPQPIVTTVPPVPGPMPVPTPDREGYIGDVKILPGSTGQRKLVRKAPDPNSQLAAVVYPDRRYPCYGETIGSTGKTWYYIWVEEESAWGWISSGYATLLQ